LQDEEPIFLEGLHTAGIIEGIRKQNPKRKVFLRLHNHEAAYYQELAQNETHPLKKFYYALEAQKLKRYEPAILRLPNALFVISRQEVDWAKRYNPQTYWLPAFFYEPTTILETPLLKNNVASLAPSFEQLKEVSLLYPANFSIPTNQRAASFLIQKILPLLPRKCKLILAGKAIPRKWQKLKHPQLFCYNCPQDMETIRQKATVIILPGRQKTGVKLKFLESVLRHPRVWASQTVVEGSGLEPWAFIFEESNTSEFLRQLSYIFTPEFLERSMLLRQKLLELYDPPKRILEMLAIINR
jgi:hypothetical protein